MDFSGKVFIITGASSGIGAGAAEYLSNLGAKLVITGRSEENLLETKKKCKKNCEILLIAGDVNIEDDRVKIIEETLKKFGKIDVLVNNAGLGIMGPTAEFSMDDYDTVMNTNVRSVFHLTQLAIPHLIKTKGNIVNISSIAGIRGVPNGSVYCMSKAALDHFTRCLSLELAPQGVRVNSINPGVVVTNFHSRAGFNEEMYKQYLDRVAATYPLRRPGTVDDIAKAIAFLASDELSSFVTGNLMTLDGGKNNVVQ